MRSSGNRSPPTRRSEASRISRRSGFSAASSRRTSRRFDIGAAAEVRSTPIPSAFPGEIQYIGQQIDPSRGPSPHAFVLTNPEGLLRLGLFGTAQVAKGAPASEPRLVVPRSTLTEIAGKSVVFVHQPDGDFELHEVVLGETAVGKVEVVSGLREGEHVVVTVRSR